MSIANCLILAGLLWIGGFTRVNLSAYRLPIDFPLQFIRVPRPMYLAFGMPKAGDLPRGVMPLDAVWVQSASLLMALYWVVIWHMLGLTVFEPIVFEHGAAGLILGIVGGRLLALSLRKVAPYDEEPDDHG